MTFTFKDGPLENQSYTRGDPPKDPELSFDGHAPCSTGLLCQVSVLRTHLYQCASWHCCERLHLASVIFLKKQMGTFF